MAHMPRSGALADGPVVGAGSRSTAGGPACAGLPRLHIDIQANHSRQGEPWPGSDGVTTPTARRDALAANQSAAGDAMDALCKAAESVLRAAGETLDPTRMLLACLGFKVCLSAAEHAS